MLQQGQVGPQIVSPGAFPNLRLGNSAEAIMQELHGRFYEQNYRGNVYSNGMTVTALTANTISLTSTTTPILGVWNPATSLVNLVILQAALQLTLPNSAAAMGVLVWATSYGNGGITTGSAPFNRKSLASSGSSAKGMAFVALTGLTNNLVIQMGSALPSLTMAQSATATVVVPPVAVENFDGGLIVPPGGVLALLNTTSNTTVSVSGYLMWEEVPL